MYGSRNERMFNKWPSGIARPLYRALHTPARTLARVRVCARVHARGCDLAARSRAYKCRRQSYPRIHLSDRDTCMCRVNVISHCNTRGWPFGWSATRPLAHVPEKSLDADARQARSRAETPRVLTRSARACRLAVEKPGVFNSPERLCFHAAVRVES